jgi:hypothetical protein
MMWKISKENPKEKNKWQIDGKLRDKKGKDRVNKWKHRTLKWIKIFTSNRKIGSINIKFMNRYVNVFWFNFSLLMQRDCF